MGEAKTRDWLVKACPELKAAEVARRYYVGASPTLTKLITVLH
jgi:hypothetical protein